MVQTISILGCTGSIGRQTAAVAEYTGIRVAALTANRQIDRLEEQARKFKPEFVAVYDENAAKELKIALSDTDIRVGSGMEGLLEAATLRFPVPWDLSRLSLPSTREKELPWPIKRHWFVQGRLSCAAQRKQTLKSYRLIRNTPPYFNALWDEILEN